jgi:tetratricopeptide (TPR) repeat protein
MLKFDFRSKLHSRCVVCLLFVGLSTPLAFAQTAPKPSPAPNPDASPSASPTGTQEPDETPASEFDEPRKLLRDGKFDEGIASLEALRTKNPEMHGLSHELGVAYYKKGDYLKAIEELKKAQAENPKDAEAAQLYGLSAYLAGRPGEAVPALEKVQTWFPNANVDAAYILGVCYIQLKDYPKARGAFAKMFNVPPDSGAAYLFTARMLLRQDFGPVAEEYAQKAVTIDPKLPLAHNLLGEVHMFHSRIPEAIVAFQKEIELNPGYANAYYKLADAYSHIQKYDDAEKLLQRSIWLDSTSSGPYILMGKVLQKKGEPELAVRALQRAVAMDPNNPMTHHLLGQAYRNMGREEEAVRELGAAGELQERQNTRP